MHSRFSGLGPLLSITVYALLFCNSAAADTILIDQVYDPTGVANISAGLSGNAIPATQKRAQSFIVGRSGILAGTDVFVNAISPGSGTLRMEIRSTQSNGLPTDDPDFLIQTTTPISNLSTSGNFFHFDLLPFQLPVNIGDRLAIVLFVEPGGSAINWSGRSGNPYSNGNIFEEQPPVQGWFSTTNIDYGFRTTVAIPEPGSFLLSSVAMSPLLLARRKRREL